MNNLAYRWENQLKPDIDHSAFDPEEDALVLKVLCISSISFKPFDTVAKERQLS